MAFQTIFKRYEKKYIVSDAKRAAFLSAISDKVLPDEYGESTICNIYFDTPDYRIIRASIEKPIYKEKLRLRTYGVPSDDTRAFIEIKKKYEGVVYKRRIGMSYREAVDYLINGKAPAIKDKNEQIFNEIDYFVHFYEGLRPAAKMSYDRAAYYCKDDSELRFTFDSEISFKKDEFDLKNGEKGKRIIADGMNVLEIKCVGSMPVWLTSVLDELEIYPTSFSKYGIAYTKYISFKPETYKSAEEYSYRMEGGGVKAQKAYV